MVSIQWLPTQIFCSLAHLSQACVCLLEDFCLKRRQFTSEILREAGGQVFQIWGHMLRPAFFSCPIMELN